MLIRESLAVESATSVKQRAPRWLRSLQRRSTTSDDKETGLVNAVVGMTESRRGDEERRRSRMRSGEKNGRVRVGLGSGWLWRRQQIWVLPKKLEAR